MTQNLPWDWSEKARQRLVHAVVLIGSALSADPAIRCVLNAEELLNREWSTVAVTLSTSMWTLVFMRFMGRQRSGWHAVWLGPCLGALNAGTSLALVTLSSGEGAGEALGGLITGTVFGIGIGGGPLGLVFGVAIAGYLVFSRPLTSNPHGPPLQLLTISTVWLLGAATLSLLIDADNAGGGRWPAKVQLLVASGLAGWTLFEHARTARWIHRLKRGQLTHFVVSNAKQDLEVCWRDRTQEGPFRTSEQLQPIGSLSPKALGLLAGQALAVGALVALPWALIALPWAIQGLEVLSAR